MQHGALRVEDTRTLPTDSDYTLGGKFKNMKILFLSPTVPFPLTDGGRIRVLTSSNRLQRKAIDTCSLWRHNQQMQTESHSYDS